MGNAHERFDRQGIKPRGGVCRWRSQRDARCHWRGTASAQCAARIGQLRSMMSSFESFANFERWRLRLPDKRESERSRHRKREVTEIERELTIC
jgi:hypothetical protein